MNIWLVHGDDENDVVVRSRSLIRPRKHFVDFDVKFVMGDFGPWRAFVCVLNAIACAICTRFAIFIVTHGHDGSGGGGDGVSSRCDTQLSVIFRADPIAKPPAPHPKWLCA